MPNPKFVKSPRNTDPKIFFINLGGEDLLHVVGRAPKITRMTG